MLEISDLSFYYTENQPIFKDFNFQIAKSEVCSLIGRSGSGKSTLLKLIYGIYDWQEGFINFNNRKLLGPKGNLVPGEPDIKWVAQEFDLMPYTTVAENVGIYFSNIDLKKKNDQIAELLEVVDLTDFKDTKVALLSGGQKQRVAIAKALAEKPELLLLDEPFSQIDSYLKNKLQRQLFKYVGQNQISVLMVTHNIQDALAFSDRIDILEEGKIIESNSPKKLYLQPKKRETALLLGDINIIPGKLIGAENHDYYIHSFQIQIKNGGEKAKVLNSYYKGGYYLLEADFKGEIIYFNNSEDIPLNTEVELEFKWQ